MTFGAAPLNEILPEHYVAELGEHARLLDLSPKNRRWLVPDVLVARGARRSIARMRGDDWRRYGRVARADQRSRCREVKVEVRNVWIEIRPAPRATPVTVIEVLSPTNKAGAGFAEYSTEATATIRRKVHLVELDLLLQRRAAADGSSRSPRATSMRWFPARKNVPNRTSTPGRSRTRLPPSRSRSCAPDPDVLLDLAAAFATVYERAATPGRIDYAAPAATMKKTADRAWAERIAKAARR